MGWPQYTWITLAVLSWVFTAAAHGKPKKGTHDIGITTAGVLLAAWVLWMGGFFG